MAMRMSRNRDAEPANSSPISESMMPPVLDAHTTSGTTHLDEQAAILALVKRLPSGSHWYELASAVEEHWSATAILDGSSWANTPDVTAAAEAVTDTDLANARALITEMADEGVSFVSVLDSYPANLHLIFNRPPFLWVRGDPAALRSRSIAVVGTRQASEEGLSIARQLGAQLAEHDVVVLSGMARGIDTAAHRGALSAGGTTVAVVGTGIRNTYPPENASLERQIVESDGAIVSQFLPDAPPARWSFPMRNVTMSGMAVGTVVIEAGSTSGAKMQARKALEHGKLLFLWKDLVTRQEWAKKYAERPGARVVQSVEDILPALLDLADPFRQMRLG